MRNPLIYLSLLILIFSTLSCNGKKETPPNIVWLVAEDQSSYFFPFYGDSSVELPNISQLLDNGTVYDNMNSPYPVCAPARSGIITGMYPNSIGTGNMRALKGNATKRNELEAPLGIPYYSSKLAEKITPFTQILIQNGYYCTNNAKEDYNFNLRDDAWNESSRSASWEKREDGQPFFSVFNFGVTHESEIWKRDKQELKVKPENLIVPQLFPND